LTEVLLGSLLRGLKNAGGFAAVMADGDPYLKVAQAGGCNV